MTKIATKLRDATEQINEQGTVGQGSNKQAEYTATDHVVPGYYPKETQYYVGVDVDEQWVHSASLTVQMELSKHGLLSNSFHRDEFTGYPNDETNLKYDYIFHVVPLGWLPDREGPKYD